MSTVGWVVSFNFGLAIALLGLAWQVWAWRCRLKAIDRSLRTAYQVAQQLENLDPALTVLTTGSLQQDYQHLEMQLRRQVSRITFVQTLVQYSYRFWLVTRQGKMMARGRRQRNHQRNHS